VPERKTKLTVVMPAAQLEAHDGPKPGAVVPVMKMRKAKAYRYEHGEREGFETRPAVNALWKEPEVFYAVGDRTRCDQVRAVLGTPTEECWKPVYLRRE
jgi:hypothetical protein